MPAQSNGLWVNGWEVRKSKQSRDKTGGIQFCFKAWAPDPPGALPGWHDAPSVEKRIASANKFSAFPPERGRAKFHRMSRRLQSAVTVCLLLGALAWSRAGEREGYDLFERRVRPVLVERCYDCHGEKKQKGGLRLDSAAAVLKGGDSGPVLVPGQPGESRLVQAVSWSNPDLQMPPKNKLAEADIAALTEWVKLGAPDPRTNVVSRTALPATAPTNHWAYQPLRSFTPPAAKNSTWPRADLDRFILAKLEASQLRPHPDADLATLLRRVYFDLIGLPPTPEQVGAFEKDRSPTALAKVVDQLLGSPQFGERWGRHWLDVARFGESVTLRGFVFKEAWRYRDYVIDAFNRDLPYDQFIREQIAGDLVPASDLAEKRRRLIATTFLALGNSNLEEQDKAQLRMDIVDEQLDTIGKAFLGQTLGCARCHDHKFDPIPTRDYYAMAGILRNTRTVTNANVSGWIENPLPVGPAEEKVFRAHEQQVADLQKEIRAAKEAAKALAGNTAEPKSSRETSPTTVAPSELPGVVVDSAQAKAVGEWKHSQYSRHYIGDGYWHDNATGKGAKTLTFLPDLKKPGLYEVRFAYVHAPNRASSVPVTVFHADGETTVSVNEQEAPALDGRFVSLGQYRFEANGFGYALVANEGTVGYVTADAVQFLPAEMAEAVAKPAPARSVKVAPKSNPKLVSTDVKSLEKQLKQLQESGPKRPLVMSVREEEKIEDTAIHVRGSVHNLGATVPRGFLQVATHAPAPVLGNQESGRRELADWMANPMNPLTARVMVNRVWHWLLGAGLVRTTDNFGTQGELPSHPELLDHLSTKFIEQGWSVKKLVREIMLSRTYQLGSQVDGLALPTDPENRHFGRANRRRLDAESIRDTMLIVSGQLSEERGGPSFQPTLSADYGFIDTGTRRSVYVPAFRNALPEIFEAFDFADPSVVVGARNVSTVAPQALFLMNHPFVRHQAQAAARRTLTLRRPDDDARLQWAYQLALGRAPSPGEQAVARRTLSTTSDETEAWTNIFHALFASADFRYLN